MAEHFGVPDEMVRLQLPLIVEFRSGGTAPVTVGDSPCAGSTNFKHHAGQPTIRAFWPLELDQWLALRVVVSRSTASVEKVPVSLNLRPSCRGLVVAASPTS